MKKIVALAGLAGVAATGLLAAPAAAQPGPDLGSACAPVRDIVARIDGATANVNYPAPLTPDAKLPGTYDLSVVLEGVCGQVDYPKPLSNGHGADGEDN